MKKERRRWLEPLASFALVFCGLTLCFSLASLGFWGEKSMAISDMASQYSAFFEAYRRGEWFFSWNAALGSGLIGTFAYYLSSPFSLLFLLFRAAPTEGVAFVILCLKLSLGSAAFALYLRARFPGLAGGFRVGFSLCYGLMSYVFFYFINVFWFDAFLWLPVAALGLEKLLAGKNSPLLLVSLVLLFASNFYIAYITGLFLLLLLLFRSVDRALGGRGTAGAVLRLAGHAGAAGLLCAPLLLPTVLDFVRTLGAEAYNNYGVFNFTAKQGLLKLFCGSFDSIGNACAPTVYCSVFVLLLAALWFFNRQIPGRTRLAGGSLVLLFLASFLLPALDIVWHGFSYPNAFAYRYAFCFSFLLILLAAQSLSLLSADCFRTQKLPLFLLGGAVLGYAALAVPFRDDLGALSVAATVAAALAYGAVVLSLCRAKPRGGVLPLLTVGLLALELCVNGALILDGVDRQNSFPAKADAAALDAEYDELLCALPDGVYRMEDTTDLNGGLRRGFMNLSLFSSSFNPDLQRFYQQIGYGGVFKTVLYTAASPLADDLLGLRYVISDSAVGTYAVYAATSQRAVYENPDALPLGFLVDPDAADFAFPGDDPAANTRALLQALCGAPSGGADDAALLDALRAAPLVIETQSKSALSGAIDAQDGGLLFLSIPYDEGWQVTVDGVRVPPVKIAGALLGVSLDAGQHTVALRYVVPGAAAGWALSALTAAGLPLAWALRRARQSRPRGASGRAASSERG